IDAFVAASPHAGDDLPFPLGGGVVACFAYELGAATVPGIAPRDPGVPLAVLRRYDPLLVYERATRRWPLLGGGHAPPWVARATRAAATPAIGPPARVAAFDRARSHDATARIRGYLHAGDAYQVNLTQPFTARLTGHPSALFARLPPAAYGAYVDLGDA